MEFANQNIEKALGYLQQGKEGKAEKILMKILKREPGNPHALHFLGICHFMKGRTKSAIYWLGKAIKADPDNPDIHNRLGLALSDSGQSDHALMAYNRALELNPKFFEALNNKGNLLSVAGRLGEAWDQYHLALDQNPEYVDAHLNLGTTLIKDGRPSEAKETFRAALKLAPDHAGPWAGMGSAHKDLGENLEAQSCFEKALELDPGDLGTWFNLHGIIYDDDDPEAACQCLERTLEINPKDSKTRFFLGVARARQGYEEEAQGHFDLLPAKDGTVAYRLDSWRYITQAGGPDSKLIGTSAEVLKMAMAAATSPGLVLEFGVRYGSSIRLIAAEAKQPVHGFDTFLGLPEDWHDEEAGTYTTYGELPETPDNVSLHQGLFEDTLPEFLDREKEMIRFINVDCDLYSSTKTIFDHLRERITRGTVIVFDEYLGNPNWREDEFKAFQEAVKSNCWTYEYLAFSLFSKQAVVMIK